MRDCEHPKEHLGGSPGPSYLSPWGIVNEQRHTPGKDPPGLSIPMRDCELPFLSAPLFKSVVIYPHEGLWTVHSADEFIPRVSYLSPWGIVKESEPAPEPESIPLSIPMRDCELLSCYLYFSQFFSYLSPWGIVNQILFGFWFLQIWLSIPMRDCEKPPGRINDEILCVIYPHEGLWTPRRHFPQLKPGRYLSLLIWIFWR